LPDLDKNTEAAPTETEPYMHLPASITALANYVFLASALTAGPALAEKNYGPGVTDSEIKVGQTMPYSGPLSVYGTYGRAEGAFFRMINELGGINGRKVRVLSLDDGYSPPKTVEQTRKLVEQEQVLLLFGNVGTPTNSAIHKYVNAKGVPHLFISTGASKWADPQHFPLDDELWPELSGRGADVCEVTTVSLSRE
jgi:branched-chain amino acid transport system substrate-binding protein